MTVDSDVTERHITLQLVFLISNFLTVLEKLYNAKKDDHGWMFVAQDRLGHRQPKRWLGMKDQNVKYKIVLQKQK